MTKENINKKPNIKQIQPINYYTPSKMSVKENPNQIISNPQKSEQRQPTSLFSTSPTSKIKEYKNDLSISTPKSNQKEDQPNVNLLSSKPRTEDFRADPLISQSSPIMKDFNTQNMVPLKESPSLFPGDAPYPSDAPHIMIKGIRDIINKPHNDLDDRDIPHAHPASAIDGIPKSIVKNGLKSIIGTIGANWETPPTNIQNATDENLSTSTGEAIATIQSPTVATITFDMGAIYPVQSIFVKIGLWKDGFLETANLAFSTSLDGIIYNQNVFGNIDITSTSDDEDINYGNISTAQSINTDNKTFRFLQIQLSTAAGTGKAHLKIYEITLLVLNFT